MSAPAQARNTVAAKTQDEIERMRVAGRLAASVLDMIEPYVEPGITTEELDRICHDYIVNECDATPAPLNYRGFPKSVCISLNHQVCHGIPGPRQLKKGDVLNIDVTVIHDGVHGDTSRMFYAGEPSRNARRVCEVAYGAMVAGIRAVAPGARLGDIGHAVQQYAESHHCSVVREYCGHGIGRGFHEEPQILHYGKAGTGMELFPGMAFTVEPMINGGKRHVKLLGDQWTVVTKDHSISAQWEHTLIVTEDGFELTTLPDGRTL
jgi:methionyl aminopeptidase